MPVYMLLIYKSSVLLKTLGDRLNFVPLFVINCFKMKFHFPSPCGFERFFFAFSLFAKRYRVIYQSKVYVCRDYT